MKKQKYEVKVGGHSWSRELVYAYTNKREAISAAYKLCGVYGTTADYSTVTDASGDCVAKYVRDPNRDGSRWYRAT